MKKKIIGILCVAVIIAGFIGFGMRQETTKTDATSVGKPTVKIGVIYPMTGNMGKFGEGTKAAADIFFNNFDSSSAKYNYEVVWEDNQNHPAKSIPALNKLIYVDKVDVIISLFSNTGLAIAPIVKEKNLLQFNGTADKNAADGVNNFIISYDNGEMAQKIAAILSDKKLNKISIIAANNAGMLDMVDTFEKTLKDFPHLEIISKQFTNPQERDFHSIIQKEKDIGADIILLQLHAPEIDIFMKQFREQNISTPISSLSAFQFINNKSLAEGIWYVDAAYPTDQYRRLYKEKTGQDNTTLSEYFYTELDIITRLYEHFDSKPSGQQLSEQLIKMKKIDNTVVGDLDIIKDGYIFAKPSLLKIQNGKIEVIEE